MIVKSNITLERTVSKLNSRTNEVYVHAVLNEPNKIINESEDINVLSYINVPSRKYRGLKFYEIFEYYLDSYGIKIIELFKILGYKPDEKAFDDLGIGVYDLLELPNNFENKINEFPDIEIKLVMIGDEQIGYLIKDHDSDEDYLANFYFISEEMAKKYFRIYFSNGDCEIEYYLHGKKVNVYPGMETPDPDGILANVHIPKPFDMDILLNYYSSIADVVFDGRILLMEFKEVIKNGGPE